MTRAVSCALGALELEWSFSGSDERYATVVCGFCGGGRTASLPRLTHRLMTLLLVVRTIDALRFL